MKPKLIPSSKASALFIAGFVMLLYLAGGCAAVTAQTAAQPSELNQLVAPIALYPDALVAQILAAATYPTQVVEADRDVDPC
ncbi:MAG TPA: DUF3300 domain-containing protein [Steroidobacteraceae bacterium]|nr:DUF3300 domain-containing protein [Steroidobacteraceae bacterium]